MADYISREKINEAFDSIWDCADMVFEPDDHCCAADDCGHCKWLQTKNAIKKKLDHISAADVRPVVRGEWANEHLASTSGGTYAVIRCSVCKSQFPLYKTNYCPNCGADMREVTTDG